MRLQLMLLIEADLTGRYLMQIWYTLSMVSVLIEVLTLQRYNTLVLLFNNCMEQRQLWEVIAHFLRKFSTLRETRSFVIIILLFIFVRTCELSEFWGESNPLLYTFSSKYVLILSCALSLDLSDRFLSVLLPMKILYVFIMSVMHTTYLFHDCAFL
jgi:hypothetical protein